MPEMNAVESEDLGPSDEEVRAELVKLLGEVDDHMTRMRKHPPTSLQALVAQVSGTVMDFMKDIVKKQIEFFDSCTGGLDDHEDRLIDLERTANGGLSTEEASKLQEFVGFANKLIDSILLAIPEGEARAEPQRMRRLGAECEEILSDFLSEDESEKEDGSEDDDSADEDSSEQSEQDAASGEVEAPKG